MALYEGFNRVEGSRSNTHLVKSGHASPAEEWLLDPSFQDQDMSGVFRNGVLMNYEYGGAGMTDVVIPLKAVWLPTVKLLRALSLRSSVQL